MKKLVLSILAVIAILAMSAPAMADTVDTEVTVGTDSTAPFMIALTATPDHTVGDGVQVNPEFAMPLANGTFAPVGSLAAASDGWRMVCFYVSAGHQNGIQNIDSVSVDMWYPDSFNAEDDPLFADRAGNQKFEINAYRSGEGWDASIVYPYTDSYPDGTIAVMPAVEVRELVYDTSEDWVDVDADGINDAGDMDWESFLPYWGTSRVQYGAGFDAAEAFDRYQFNPSQALVLEICAWMWFHQPGVSYEVGARAQTAGGATSTTLYDGNKFLHYNRVIGLYTDFDTVDYGTVSVGNTSWANGDRYLNTPALTTVWNNGNASAQVLVQSTKMVKHIPVDNGWDWQNDATNIQNSDYYNSPAKTIIHFDAELYYTNGLGQTVQYGYIQYLADSAPAVIAVGGETGDPVLLQACRPAKIQFSVEPESGEGQEAGDYSGFLTVTVAPYTGTQMPTP